MTTYFSVLITQLFSSKTFTVSENHKSFSFGTFYFIQYVANMHTLVAVISAVCIT